MQKQDTLVFNPDVPPDLEHASHIREEAFDWLDTHFPGVPAFTTGDVLRMAGEQRRRWLITRLREKGIGNEEMFSMPATADALTVLFLRLKGVKFREAVEAVLGGESSVGRVERPGFSGVWNRLVVNALDRLRRRIPPRLLGSAVFSLIRDQKDHPNCLVIVKRRGKDGEAHSSDKTRPVSHDYAYRTILERPAPSCSVVAPSLEVLFFGTDQLPARAEVTARHFVGLQVVTEREVYEVLLGTIRPASVSMDASSLEFVGRVLDVVFLDFEEFHRTQSSTRFETKAEPERGGDDLQLWLIAQFLHTIYSGALCEVIEASHSSSWARALASSAARPWEPSLWDPPKSLEMMSGYAGRVGVPLVVERVEYPWTLIIKSVEPEMRYLASSASNDNAPRGYSAIALPIMLSSGNSIGSLYMLMPRIEGPLMDVEVRILTVFSRIIGETIERQRAAIHSANVSRNIANLAVLKQADFKAALLDMLGRKAAEIRENEHLPRDVRLPFLLLSAHRPDPDESDPTVSGRLRDWLVETLSHLEWRSFVQSHWSDAPQDYGADSFMGELPGVGMMLSLGKMVSKDELDRIRDAFPTTINRISPTNAPVKLVTWVLDVPAQRILDASTGQDLQELADDVERWAFDVATIVDDVAQSEMLAEQGDWDAVLRRIRKALQKEGGRTNAYLRRMAADCSFSLGDWPSALKYAQEAAKLDRLEMGSGLVRSICQEGDAHLCLCNPVAAWDLYTEAASQAPDHPLPRYYRGQGLLLMARLIDAFQDERLRASRVDAHETEQVDFAVDELVNGAMDDLTSAADLLDRWGLIPESYQYQNFNLVPTLMGQGVGYLLGRAPGPAASRLQSARRAFPKDDLFFREFLFAKCWEQGLHRRYGALLLGDDWSSLRDRLLETFGEPLSWRSATEAYGPDA